MLEIIHSDCIVRKIIFESTAISRRVDHTVPLGRNNSTHVTFGGNDLLLKCFKGA